MCGIAGIAPTDSLAVPARTTLERMIRAVRHRGPDGFGFHTAPGIGLAHTRLSIIDLATGDQPVANEDGSVVVVFNGEIFDYVELTERLSALGHRFRTRSDTEVIVHAYEEYGLDFVRHLNGQFAIALWDSRRRRLVLGRDRVGIRPLLYSRRPDGIAFASEAKSLFAAGWVEPRIDPLALAEVATFWSCVAPRTPFSCVESLPPGHLAVWERGRLEVRRYWDWEFPARDDYAPRELDAATEELRALFVDCVRLQLRADVPVGAYLSGGLDSSAVAAAVRRFSDAPLRTFSIAFASAELDEGAWQREMAAHLRTDHETRSVGAHDVGAAFERAIRHVETPVVRTAGVPLMLLADRVRAAGFKVVLTGEGADEVFGGYDLFKEGRILRFWARQPASKVRPQLLRRLYGYLGNSPTARGAMAESWFRQFIADEHDPWLAHRPRWATTGRTLRLLTPDARAAIDREHPLARLAELAPRPDARWSPLCRDQYVEAHTLLAGYLLHSQGDRVAMAASVEGRYPFLDHRLIEFANNVPPRWKLNGLEEKYLLRRAVEPWLPPQIATRPKQPYRAPDAESFFVDGRPLEYVAEALSPASVAAAGLFQPEAVSRLLEKCRSGAAIGFADNMAFVTVLSTQLLHRDFVAPSRSHAGHIVTPVAATGAI